MLRIGDDKARGCYCNRCEDQNHDNEVNQDYSPLLVVNS